MSRFNNSNNNNNNKLTATQATCSPVPSDEPFPVYVSLSSYGSSKVLLIDGCDGLGCNPSCPSELLLPASRDESDSVVVWAVVLVTFACAALVLGAGTLCVCACIFKKYVIWGGFSLRPERKCKHSLGTSADFLAMRCLTIGWWWWPRFVFARFLRLSRLRRIVFFVSPQEKSIFPRSQSRL